MITQIDTQRILIAILESQLLIEKERCKGYANTGDVSVYWMKYASQKVIDEIQKQLHKLKQ
jgi:hypothetical protein